MEQRDVIVIGGGIAGLSFAWHATRAGQRALVLEAAPRAGGCLDSRRVDAGSAAYWYELGAHTCYNSYQALLEIVDATGLGALIRPRGEARKRFALLRDGRLTTMGPLSVFRQFSWWQLAGSLLRAVFSRKRPGLTTRAHFSRLVGADNYQRVLAPFLSAVPSQAVDDFPASGAGSLFKKRTRRKDVIKTFSFDGGLGSVVDKLAGLVETRTGAAVSALRPQAEADGGGYEVELADGQRLAARTVALAVGPAAATRLLAPGFPALAAPLARIATVEVDSVGVVVPRSAVALPELAFIVPAADIFWSAVTRDPLPDPARRAFAFHFRPGHSQDERLACITRVLGVAPEALEVVHTRSTTLPSPALGHDAVVAELDRGLAGTRLALTGNYFAGLAIEDCVARSKAEWTRVAR